jgi:hypothetical protein
MAIEMSSPQIAGPVGAAAGRLRTGGVGELRVYPSI